MAATVDCFHCCKLRRLQGGGAHTLLWNYCRKAVVWELVLYAGTTN